MPVTKRLLLHLAGADGTERMKDGVTSGWVTHGSHDSRNFR